MKLNFFLVQLLTMHWNRIGIDVYKCKFYNGVVFNFLLKEIFTSFGFVVAVNKKKSTLSVVFRFHIESEFENVFWVEEKPKTW